MSDRYVTAKELATALGISNATLWRNVAVGRLPPPLYPSPRAPRWRWGDGVAAMEQTCALPREAAVRRRPARVQSA